MISEEQIKLILDLGKSAASTKEVQLALEQLEKSTKATAQGYEVLERQTGVYEVMERRVVTTTKELNVEVSKEQQFYAALLPTIGDMNIKTEELAMVTNKVRGTGGASGYGILGASYAVQDFTSQLGTRGLGGALGAIQNNIPILIASLGAGAGLAGAVSIVAVGVGLLYDNWGKLKDYWTGGETEKEAERMKKLAEETTKAKEATEALVKVLPQWQRQPAADVKRAVESFGGEAVLKELSESLVRGYGDFGKEINRTQAQTLMTNLMQGDPSAIRFLRDLPTRGAVGTVLQGGKTPEEAAKAADDLNRRREKEQVDFEKAQAQKAEERRKEMAQQRKEEQDEEAKFFDQMEEEVRTDKDKRVKDSMHLGRSVGKAFENKNKETARPTNLRPVPLIPEGANQAEVERATMDTQRTVIENQGLLVQKLRAIEQANRAAKRVNQALVTHTESPMPR